MLQVVEHPLLFVVVSVNWYLPSELGVNTGLAQSVQLSIPVDKPLQE
jgi:hypothetical protein